MNSILIVDDEESIRNVYSRLLKREGYKPFEASNANEANELIKRNKIDLVLLDINMADVDGGEFYEVIRDFHSDTKVIVSSVYPLDEQKQHIPSAVDYYDKSDSLRVLLDKVKSVFLDNSERGRVLVIDYDSEMRENYQYCLKRRGYSTTFIANPDRLLKYLKRNIHDLDLIILDLDLPRISGLHIFELIKGYNPLVKVLICSALPVDEQQFFVFDADAYYDKREGLDVLLHKIDRLLKIEDAGY